MINIKEIIYFPDTTFNFVGFLFLSMIKFNLLLGIIYFICRFFRRFSAAAKHLIWTTGLLAGLLFPLLFIVKNFEVPILPTQMFLTNQRVNSAAENVPELSNDNSSENSLFSIDNKTMKQNNEDSSATDKISGGIIAVWLFGIMILLLRLAFGIISTRSRLRQKTIAINPFLAKLVADLSQEIKLKEKVEIIVSRDVTMPLVYGLWNSKIFLPEIFESWSAERQRMVLLHELAHIKRRDCLTQLSAQIAGIVYWFNPLVWLAARHLRTLRELACDEYVLNAGTKPSVYAGHLLDIARSLRNESFFDSAQTITASIAQKSEIETRLSAILDSRQKRRKSNRLMKAGTVFAVAMFAFSMSVLQFKSQTKQAENLPETSIGNQQKSDDEDHLKVSRQNDSIENFKPIVNKKARKDNDNFGKAAKIQTDSFKARNPALNRQDDFIKEENQTSNPAAEQNNKLKPLGRLATPLKTLPDNLGSLKPLKTGLEPLGNF